MFGNKLVIIVAAAETLLGWSIIHFTVQMGLVQSLELGNSIIFAKSMADKLLIIVADWKT